MFYQYRIFYKVLSDHLGREVLNSRQVESETFTASEVEKIAMRYHDDMVGEEIGRGNSVVALVALVVGIAIGIGVAYLMSNFLKL